MSRRQDRRLLREDRQGLSVQYVVQVGQLGGNDRACGLVHFRLRIAQPLFVVGRRQGGQGVFETIQCATVVLGLLVVLAGDGLSRRSDLLTLGQFLRCFQGRLTNSDLSSQRSQLLFEPGQRAPRAYHFTGLGDE